MFLHTPLWRFCFQPVFPFPPYDSLSYAFLYAPIQPFSKPRCQRHSQSHELTIHNLFNISILHLDFPAPAHDQHCFQAKLPQGTPLLQECHFAPLRSAMAPLT